MAGTAPNACLTRMLKTDCFEGPCTFLPHHALESVIIIVTVVMDVLLS